MDGEKSKPGENKKEGVEKERKVRNLKNSGNKETKLLESMRRGTKWLKCQKLQMF